MAELNQKDKYASLVEEIFSIGDVKVNGDRLHDIKIKDKRFYKRFIKDGVVGLGEAFVDGWWECQDLPELIYRLLKANLRNHYKTNPKMIYYLSKLRLFHFLKIKLTYGKKANAFDIGRTHYDLGNELFKTMLDKRMIYSCGYWENANSLEAAQEAKLDLICKKLLLKPGMRVLDIGCGWGGFGKYASEKYGVEVVGITVSKEQAEFAKKISAGLPIEIRLQDYRDLNETFDRIVSVGMFEHVCRKNYRVFMNVAYRCLRDQGLFLLHSIGANSALDDVEEAWISKYIWPNSELPTIQTIGEALEHLFVVEDLHNFGTDYEKTLESWFQKFSQGWDHLKGDYDDRFFRMWKFYLLSCLGAFRARFVQLWQWVLSKDGLAGGYQRNFYYQFR